MTEVITTTANAAKHATRAFAQAISLDQGDLSTRDVEALAGELREILISARQALRVVEHAAPDAATANDLRDAKQSAGAAARSLAHAYPTAPTDGITPGEGFSTITQASEIEALTPRTELIVDGTVYRVSRTKGCQTYVRDLPGIDFMRPGQLIELFQEIGILTHN